MTTWLIHGFNVSDGGRGSVGKLRPFLSQNFFLYSYGWTGLICLDKANQKATRALARHIKPGDNIIAHSNGCLVAWHLANKFPDRIKKVVCINPALRRDTRWPRRVRVLCLHNRTDLVVQLGRMWGRLSSDDGIRGAGWGAAGRYGFDAGQRNISNWDTSDPWWRVPAKGHSGLFRGEAVRYWGVLINAWIKMG